MATQIGLPKRLQGLDPARPVLIAGPTASGKSALALAIAEAQGGVIVNADAIQVFADWQVLTARPDAMDEARARHILYGHVPGDQPYSVGAWLREVAPLLASAAMPPVTGPVTAARTGPASGSNGEKPDAAPMAERPIIVGGTGLYFTALTEGLAEIPPTPADVRAEGEARLATDGLAAMVAELDRETAAAIDLQNPARVARAWEVLTATGRGLRGWQRDTPPPLLPLAQAQPLLVDAPRDWLTPRIADRFAQMVEGGALDEARANAANWHPGLPSAKAIGAAELMAHLAGEMTLPQVIERATILTRQFAKRQRTWFKARMNDWPRIQPGDF